MQELTFLKFPDPIEELISYLSKIGQPCPKESFKLKTWDYLLENFPVDLFHDSNDYQKILTNLNRVVIRKGGNAVDSRLKKTCINVIFAEYIWYMSHFINV